jgi:DNA excision repair protein ERCC-2
VYTLHDLRVIGRKRQWCPYFLARHMIAFSNVVVYNYQYMIDPKVRQWCLPCAALYCPVLISTNA